MATTASHSTLNPKSRGFVITEAALSNWRGKVKGFPQMDDDKLAIVINEEVNKAIDAGKWEKIEDNNEPARLVHLTEGTDPYFALVKKSSNPSAGEFAVVTIMTPKHVEQKRQTQWSTSFGLSPESKKKLEAVRPSEPSISSGSTPTSNVLNLNKSERQPVGGEKPNTFLISYVPFRAGVDVNKRVYEEWGSEKEAENRISEVKMVAGTLRVYKELAIGYRILLNE